MLSPMLLKECSKVGDAFLPLWLLGETVEDEAALEAVLPLSRPLAEVAEAKAVAEGGLASM